MEDFAKLSIIVVLIFFVTLLMYFPFISSTNDRLTALEKLHNKTVCVHCDSDVEK